MQWILILFISALSSLAITSCVSPTEVPFDVVAEGHRTAVYVDRRGLVIRSSAEWEELWQQLHRYTVPQPLLPEVAFQQHILLAVFAGEKTSGGYDIQIKRITQTQHETTVHATETSPGRGQMTTANMSYPYQVVRAPRFDLPVRFRFRQE